MDGDISGEVGLPCTGIAGNQVRLGLSISCTYFEVVCTSDVNKDLGFKAKAKDLGFKAKFPGKFPETWKVSTAKFPGSHLKNLENQKERN